MERKGAGKLKLSSRAWGTLTAFVLACAFIGYVAWTVTASFLVTGASILMITILLISSSASQRTGGPYHGGYTYEKFSRRGDPGGTRGYDPTKKFH